MTAPAPRGDVSPGWARDLRRVRRPRADARSAYDRASRWYRFTEEPFERRARAVGLGILGARPGEHVLEVGCGTGSALVSLARAVAGDGRLVGLDISPGMLHEARARLERAGLADRVELVTADAMSMPFDDTSFDALFAAFTLELFDTPEIPRLLDECRRVLRPAGRIVVVSLSRSEPVRWPTRLYERLHDRFPATLDCRPIRPAEALQAAGFRLTRSKRIPLWGLRAEAVVAVRQADGGEEGTS